MLSRGISPLVLVKVILSEPHRFVFIKPSTQSGCDTRPSFQAVFNKFECRVFLLQDWLPYQSSLYCLLIAGGRIIGCTCFPRCKQPHPKFQLGLLYLFPRKIIILPQALYTFIQRFLLLFKTFCKFHLKEFCLLPHPIFNP